MSEVTEILRRMEKRQIIRNKIVVSILAVVIIIAPLAVCLWSVSNQVWIEAWRYFFKLAGVVTFTIGTILICVYCVFYIWRDY